MVVVQFLFDIVKCTLFYGYFSHFHSRLCFLLVLLHCLDDVLEITKQVAVMVAQLVSDVNIAVAVEAVQAIGNLASGLRKDFNSGSKLLLPVLLVYSACLQVFFWLFAFVFLSSICF